MSAHSGPNSQHTTLVTQCQVEVQQMMATLRALDQVMGLRSWSDEIDSSYRLLMDDLATLDAQLYLYRLSLPPNALGPSSAEDASPT